MLSCVRGAARDKIPAPTMVFESAFHIPGMGATSVPELVLISLMRILPCDRTIIDVGTESLVMATRFVGVAVGKRETRSALSRLNTPSADITPRTRLFGGRAVAKPATSSRGQASVVPNHCEPATGADPSVPADVYEAPPIGFPPDVTQMFGLRGYQPGTGGTPSLIRRMWLAVVELFVNRSSAGVV